MIKKNKRKIKRVQVPKTYGDYEDNAVLDLKNLTMHMDKLEKLIEKAKWFAFQLKDDIKQMNNILRQRGLAKQIREKEQF